MADATPDIPKEWLDEFEAAARRSLETRVRYSFIKTIDPSWTMHRSARLTRCRTTAIGAKENCPIGWDMAAFEYRQAQEVRDAFNRHGCRYLFIGKSGATLLGFPDTNQTVELFVEKSSANGRAVANALIELGFSLTADQATEIQRGKDFVQLKNGPFDLDLIFAPDGIEHFEDAWKRRIDVEGFPVCSLDDIIASKIASNRQKDRESLPRLQSFREYRRARNSR